MYNDRVIRSSLDGAYPNRRRYIDDVRHIGSDELLPTNLSGEVELIARSSYMLGASQMEAREAQVALHDVQNERDSLKSQLDTAKSNVETYKERAYRYSAMVEKQNARLKRKDAEITRLKNKINPPKPAVKKEAK